MKMMKLLQEMQGLARMSQRRPQRSRWVILLQLRSHVRRPAPHAEGVFHSMHEMPDIPNPVKITFIKNKPAIPDSVAVEFLIFKFAPFLFLFFPRFSSVLPCFPPVS